VYDSVRDDEPGVDGTASAGKILTSDIRLRELFCNKSHVGRTTRVICTCLHKSRHLDLPFLEYVCLFGIILHCHSSNAQVDKNHEMGDIIAAIHIFCSI
jgi:hypothetical protein